MAREEDKEYISLTIHQEGWFNGLTKLMKENKITSNEAAKLKSHMFNRLNEKLKEARREVDKFQAVIQRIEAVCKQGTIVKPFHGLNAADSDVIRLRQEVKTFHGWAVSLAETDAYFLAAAESPQRASDAFHNLWEALAKLQLVRGVSFKDPEWKGSLFDV